MSIPEPNDDARTDTPSTDSPPHSSSARWQPTTPLVMPTEGVASVFGVATAPEVRGRGLGAAITLIAYDEARQMGYQHGVLFGTELGVPVYGRIGFREVSTTISRYLWRA
jgi:GNAT superfamily N-acetyltransferase